jgi:hypothetical protein
MYSSKSPNFISALARLRTSSASFAIHPKAVLANSGSIATIPLQKSTAILPNGEHDDPSSSPPDIARREACKSSAKYGTAAAKGESAASTTSSSRNVNSTIYETSSMRSVSSSVMSDGVKLYWGPGVPRYPGGRDPSARSQSFWARKAPRSAISALWLTRTGILVQRPSRLVSYEEGSTRRELGYSIIV